MSPLLKHFISDKWQKHCSWTNRDCNSIWIQLKTENQRINLQFCYPQRARMEHKKYYLFFHCWSAACPPKNGAMGGHPTCSTLGLIWKEIILEWNLTVLNICQKQVWSLETKPVVKQWQDLEINNTFKILVQESYFLQADSTISHSLLEEIQM